MDMALPEIMVPSPSFVSSTKNHRVRKFRRTTPQGSLSPACEGELRVSSGLDAALELALAMMLPFP